MVAIGESAEPAERLLAQTITQQNIDRDTLTIHADDGSSMASKPVALLLADLGVVKSHSRPHTSNDNPCSGAGFKTLKHRPDVPERSGSVHRAHDRACVLAGAHAARPERFVRHRPRPPALPATVWIDPPDRTRPPTA